MNDKMFPASFKHRKHQPKILTEEEKQANVMEWLVERIIFVMTQSTKLTADQCLEAVHEADCRLNESLREDN